MTQSRLRAPLRRRSRGLQPVAPRVGDKLPLSVAIIAFNEEHMLGEALESVAFADEVIVVDSFSNDRTVEIAREFGAKVHQHPWLGYAAQKNLAVSLCTNDWILSLDADERVSPRLLEEIAESIRTSDRVAGFSIPRENWFLGRPIRHGGWYPDRSVRLFKRGAADFGTRLVHEKATIVGAQGDLHGPIIHRTCDDIEVFLRKLEGYAALASRDLAKGGRRANVVDLLVRPLWTFARMYFLRRGFLDGSDGFILAGCYASYTFSKYLRLREHGRRAATSP